MQTVNQDGQGAKLPAHETFRVAAVLALVGGFLDIYTYLLRGGVFANAQTGNIVLLAANLAETNWSRAGYDRGGASSRDRIAAIVGSRRVRQCDDLLYLLDSGQYIPKSEKRTVRIDNVHGKSALRYRKIVCIFCRAGAESFGKCGALFRDYRDVHRRSGLGRGSSQDLGSKKCLDLLSASGRDNSGDQRATKEINKEKQQNRPDERDFQKEDPRPSGLFFVCAMGAF